MVLMSSTSVRTAPTKPPTRERSKQGLAEPLGIFEEEERHNGNQDEPGKIAQEREQARDAGAEIVRRGVGRPGRGPVYALADGRGNTIRVDEVPPPVEPPARLGDIDGDLPPNSVACVLRRGSKTSPAMPRDVNSVR